MPANPVHFFKNRNQTADLLLVVRRSNPMLVNIAFEEGTRAVESEPIAVASHFEEQIGEADLA
jgi:hypothetical protein